MFSLFRFNFYIKCLGILGTFLFINLVFYWNLATTMSHDTSPVTSRLRQNVTCDVRMVVLTYDRADSLKKLLRGLRRVETDGSALCVDIWIDRNRKGLTDPGVLRAAEAFRAGALARGTGITMVTVHVQERHVGVYGQWIDSWRPPDPEGGDDGGEVGLILEDDVSVSPWVWLWLRAAVRRYGTREDLAGYTLQSEGVYRADGSGPLTPPPGDVAYLYRRVGTWGFAPHPRALRGFRAWYHSPHPRGFLPLIPKLEMSDWYRNLSHPDTGAETSMWEMWFIYYCHHHGYYYTLYNNIRQVSGLKQGLLLQNRREAGLHFTGSASGAARNLLQHWDKRFIDFPNRTKMLGYNGEQET